MSATTYKGVEQIEAEERLRRIRRGEVAMDLHRLAARIDRGDIDATVNIETPIIQIPENPYTPYPTRGVVSGRTIVTVEWEGPVTL